jgi:hypothetical protein
MSAAGAALTGLSQPPASAERLPPPTARDALYEETYRRLLGLGPEAELDQPLSLLVACRYRTDPERLARRLPPYLEPDDDAEVLLDWLVIFAPPEHRTAFGPAWTYSEADMMVAAKFEGHRCMLPVALVLEQDFGRYAGRQGRMHRKKDGQVEVDVRGNRVRAWCSRRGDLLSAIETVMTEQPSHPMFWLREVGWGWMRADYRLDPDWRRGPIEAGEVKIWRHLGFDEGYPTGMPDEQHFEALPRACELTQTRVVVGGGPNDPWGELPVRELLGVSCLVRRGSGSGASDSKMEIPRGADRTPVPRSRNSGRHCVARLDARQFQEWALSERGYDRPITSSKVWVPGGWPETATAFTLTRQEIERWRSRETMDVDAAYLVDIRLELKPEDHRRTLPPPCDAGDSPEVKILAVRAEKSDFTTLPFGELWLLSRGILASRPIWYALSHIVSWDADCFFGRETFGWPTKVGEPEITVDPLQATVLGRRFGRCFLTATIPLELEQGGGSKDRFEVLGLQGTPKDVEPAIRFVAQPWSLNIDTVRRARPDEVQLDFPADPGPARIGHNEPWFDFSEARIVSVVAGPGRIRRSPGRISAADTSALTDEWIYDRNDGITGQRPQNGSFLIGG